MDFAKLRERVKEGLETVAERTGARQVLERPDVKRALHTAGEVTGEVAREVRNAGKAVAVMLDRRPAADDLHDLKARLDAAREEKASR